MAYQLTKHVQLQRMQYINLDAHFETPKGCGAYKIDYICELHSYGTGKHIVGFHYSMGHRPLSRLFSFFGGLDLLEYII